VASSARCGAVNRKARVSVSSGTPGQTRTRSDELRQQEAFLVDAGEKNGANDCRESHKIAEAHPKAKRRVPIMYLTEYMARQNKPVLLCIGIVLLAAVIFLEKASPAGFDTSVFYLVPVSFFASFLGRRAGLAISLLCASVALLLHRTMLPSGSSLVYWNVLAWFAVYVFFVYIISELRSLYARERSWSHTDPLTGIPNRRSFFERLEIESHRSRRYDRPISLAYIDVDRFKEVNDMFGHDTGDKLLGIVADVMKQAVRKVDLVARLGGDEFAILFPETDRAAAATALNNVRSSVDAAMTRRKWPVRFSVGLVTFQTSPDSVQEIINAADQAMYEAKRSGSGRLVVHQPAA